MAIINPLPSTITNGNPVDATPVQANFQQIVNNVNANAAPVAGNSAQTFDVATATVSTNAVPLAQMNTAVATAVPLAGGTMTGALILSADPTTALGAATKEYVDNAGVTSFNTRTGAVTLTSTDVSNALGYTPYNSSNPAGYTPSSSFGNSLTTNGYQHLPGGLIIQWGIGGSSVGETVNFPIPFPNACFMVTATPTGNNGSIPSVSTFTTTGFYWNPGNAGTAPCWIALGY